MQAVIRFRFLVQSTPGSSNHISSSVDEVQRMLRTVDGRHRGQWQSGTCTIRTLLLLLYGTGLRIGEAIHLQHRDVDLEALNPHDSRYEVLQVAASPC